jgi:uncharacterized protein YndB with AHSA1/START domain
VTANAHLYEIFIRADRERVWEALTDPELTVQYFHRTRLESSFRPGAPYRYVLDHNDVDAVDGVIETFDPPHRLVMTWHVLYDVEMSVEPPSRVEWTLTPANDDGTVTRVTLRHGDLAMSPKTWANVRLGWVQVIDAMKTLLETGESLPPFDVEPGDADPSDVEGAWHRAEASAANNAAWELLDGRELGPDAADELLGRAYAAAHHWRRSAGATVINQARASWLLSRAHAVLGHGEIALHHAQQCAKFTAQAPDDASDFDHAYVFESRARALACLGQLDEAGEVYRRAAAVRIADDQDRAIFESDLAAEPWFTLAR